MCVTRYTDAFHLLEAVQLRNKAMSKVRGRFGINEQQR